MHPAATLWALCHHLKGSNDSTVGKYGYRLHTLMVSVDRDRLLPLSLQACGCGCAVLASYSWHLCWLDCALDAAH